MERLTKKKMKRYFYMNFHVKDGFAGE